MRFGAALQAVCVSRRGLLHANRRIIARLHLFKVMSSALLAHVAGAGAAQTHPFRDTRWLPARMESAIYLNRNRSVGRCFTSGPALPSTSTLLFLPLPLLCFVSSSLSILSLFVAGSCAESAGCNRQRERRRCSSQLSAAQLSRSLRHSPGHSSCCGVMNWIGGSRQMAKDRGEGKRL